MLSRDGAEHDRHREPFAAPFRRAPVMERFAGRVAEEVDGLIDGFAADGRAELRSAFAAPPAAARARAARTPGSGCPAAACRRRRAARRPRP
jgi:cytochrome P450